METTLPFEKWFRNEVYFWRNIAITIWFILLLPIVITGYLFLTYADMFHIFAWINNTISVLFSLSFIFWLSIVILLCGAQLMFSLQWYTVVPIVTCGNTRFKQIVSLFWWSRLPLLASYLAVGFLVSWISATYFVRYSFGALTVYLPDSDDTFYLNEEHVFFVTFGIYTSFVGYVRFFLRGDNCLEFTLEKKRKQMQVREEVLNYMKKCVKQALPLLFVFYVLYFFFGGIICQWICGVLQINQHPDMRPLNSLLGLFNVQVFWQTLLLGVLLNSCWKLGNILSRAYHVEQLSFPMDCLGEAMMSTNNGLLQFLGYLDASYLAQFSKERRKVVFSLSQPGGHPHTWDKLSTACLANIDALTQRVQDSNQQTMTRASLVQPPIKMKLFDESYFHARTPVAGAKSLLATPCPTVLKDTPPTEPAWKLKISLMIRESSVLKFLFHEIANAKSQQLFASAQTTIWSVEALSHLATASYTEDKFGVVQRFLPTIMNSLLLLQRNTEQFSKLHSSAGSLNQRLQLTLRTNINRIQEVFGQHLMDIPYE